MHDAQAAHAEHILQPTSEALLQVRIREAHITLRAEPFMKVLDEAVQQLRNSTVAEPRITAAAKS